MPSPIAYRENDGRSWRCDGCCSYGRVCGGNEAEATKMVDQTLTAHIEECTPAMASPADNRTAAEACLVQAQRELGCIPVGRVPTDVLLAHSAKAQALATMALAQAVLTLSQPIKEQPEASNDHRQ